MMPRLAILCPGQGGQHSAMFDLLRADPRTAALPDQWLSEADLGQPLTRILTDDSLLFSNRLAQPLIVAASLAAWSALKDFVPIPELVAGYSIGELAAHAIAGVVAPQPAIRLAALRANLMDVCAQQSPRQVLFAVSGIEVCAVATLVAPLQLYVAIEIDVDSCIVGGYYHDLRIITDDIIRLGGRINVLPVTVASHTPLMNAAVAPFAEELRTQLCCDPQLPVLSGLSGEIVTKKEQAVSVLSSQIAQTIHWNACMDACAEHRITAALELGPGAALSRMLQARHPHIACRSVSEFRTLQGVLNWLERL
ncbi:acyltransferase domain-containing protein [Glaciimonas soli]|uniref:Acyltransferase domain-containing protein n=1 Tax=Glaciimonas soli TaxID=2590999 RepID=A0A843YJX0_9BURK|nr:acyltransferase domain-containing protein [Glaciimonas soli]MQQ99684.1 acyltransferase domain-containing protein [Glaciimonas soli]